MLSRRRKNHKANKSMKNGKPRERAKKSSKLKNSKLSLTLSMQAPLDKHYHASSLNHPISKEFNQLCVHTLPL
jgi:hypothetical protein